MGSDTDRVILVGIVTLALALLTLVVAIVRSNKLPEYESREEALAKRVSDLEVFVRVLQESLVVKEREIEKLRLEVHQLSADAIRPPPAQALKPSLVVLVGDDAMLEEDLAKLRGARSFSLTVLRSPTLKDFESLVAERRGLGRPVRNVHMAMHADVSGVAFADGMADGLWLSRHLKGVDLLVLAACQSNRVANLLSVVPVVVSMRASLDNTDARIFALAFWRAVGEGLLPEEAFFAALDRSPAAVAEMAEFHEFRNYVQS